MAQFYTSHLYNGWYDTRFSMPAMVQQPYYYYTDPYTLPSSAWFNTLQSPSNPIPIIQTQLPKANTPPSPASRSAPTVVKGLAFPVKPRLRSILKSPRTNPITPKKTVRFTTSTASPPPAAPGTYKHTGKPRPPRARHPARNHPCLRNKKAQQLPPQAHQQLPARTPSADPSGSPGPKQISRPPTPPPAAFFTRNNTPQMRAQPHSQRSVVGAQLKKAVPPPPQRPNTSARRTQPYQALTYRPPQNISHIRNNSVDSNTDAQAARLASTMQKMKLDAEKEARAHTRRSLQALAKEYDRKNAWKLVSID